MNIGAWYLRQASSFSSSAVIGPVVSWEPTVVIRGSQAVPGRMQVTPHAAPTIFWAWENACFAFGFGLSGRVKTSDGLRPRAFLALSVTARPMISGMRPPARNSSARVLGAMELGEDLLPLLVGDLTFLRVDDDHVAGLHPGHVRLQRQRAGVLGGIEEDRGDDAADDDAGGLLVRDAGDLVADGPQHAVAGGLAGRAGADHVADEGDLEAVLAELGDGVEAPLEAGPPHGEGVERDVGAAPGVAGRGEVVGVDLAVDLEYLHLDLFGYPLAGGEPLGLGPGLQHLGGGGVLRLGQRGHF